MGGVIVKNLLLVAAGICLSLIILASLPLARPDAAGSSMLHKVYWANPDGSRGVTGEIATVGHSGTDRGWINPDGVYGTVGEKQVGQSQAKNHFWINPDGRKGMLDGSTDDREGLRATAIAARK